MDVAEDTFNALGDLIFELNNVSIQHGQCLAGKNFLGQSGCWAGYGWDIQFALTRAARKVGLSVLFNGSNIGAIVGFALDASSWSRWVESQVASSSVLLHAARRLDQAASVTQPASLLGKVAREPNGTSWYIDLRGNKHHVPDGGVYDCLLAEGSTKVDVTSAQVAALPRYEPAQCVRADPGDIIKHPDGDSYVLTYGPGGFRRSWIPTSGVYRCAQAEGRNVKSVPRYFVDDITSGANRSSQTCIIRGPGGDAHFVNNEGRREWVPDAPTFDCEAGRGVPVQDVPADFVTQTAQAGWHYCYNQALFRGKVLSHSDGDSSYVHPDNTRTWIPDGPTFDCRMRQGKQVVQTRWREYVDGFTNSGWDYCFDPALFRGRVLSHSDGDSSYIHPDNTRTWIPDGPTFDCRMRQGKQVVQTRWREYVNNFRDTGWDYCYDINTMKGTIISHPAGDSHYIDAAGVRHWIPSEAVFNCLRSRGISQTTVRWREYINNTPEGGWATC